MFEETLNLIRQYKTLIYLYNQAGVDSSGLQYKLDSIYFMLGWN